MSRLLLCIVIAAGIGCDHVSTLGCAWTHHIDDSVDVYLNYHVPSIDDPEYDNYSYTYLVFQEYANIPDYILTVPTDAGAVHVDTVRMKSGITFYVCYSYRDSLGSQTDTIEFYPYQESLYFFGYGGKQ